MSGRAERDLSPRQIGMTLYRTSIPRKTSLGEVVYINAVKHLQRELFSGLIRIHVLVHATHEAIFGLAMMEELGHHGYRVGPGTLGLEDAGLLKSALKIVDSRRRRVYKITALGRKALESAKVKVDELHFELHQSRPRKITSMPSQR